MIVQSVLWMNAHETGALQFCCTYVLCEVMLERRIELVDNCFRPEAFISGNLLYIHNYSLLY